MQLISASKKRSGSIATALAAASSMLLHLPAQADEPWLVETDLLTYNETGRVSVLEPMISMKKNFNSDQSLSMKFTYDSLTGATPTGAVPQLTTETLTGSSGRPSTTISVGELPKDKHFQDQRKAFNAGWEQTFDENNHLNISGGYSTERDYFAKTYSISFARDLFSKNTTVSLGSNWEKDDTQAIGGNPIGFQDIASTQPRSNSDKKNGHDILFGISQVMNRDWLTQLNYSRSTNQGYQSEPYKVISILDASGNTIADPNSADQLWQIYEKRPDSRKRQSIFWNNKIHLEEDVISVSVRHYWDDWGIKSNTFDIRYRLEVGNNMYWEPHYRHYTQTAANFYLPYLIDGQTATNGTPTVSYASTDERLSNFAANTYGFKWGFEIGRNSEFSIRYERYLQKGSNLASNYHNLSGLNGLNLTPGLNANNVMISYSFEY